jgi:hypothetical protein
MTPYLQNIWTSWNAQTSQLVIDAASGITEAQHQTIWTSWVGKVASQQNLAAISQQVQQINQASVWSNWYGQIFTQSAQQQSQRRQQTLQTAQQDRWRQDQERASRIEQDRRRAEQEAKDRAEVLLLRYLSDKQKEDLRTKNYFLVEVGGETYKIMRGFAGNVKMLDKATGREAKSFCIHPHERVPDADAMLAQKLLLEADTEKFLKIANVTELLPRALTPQNDNRAAA